ncbi:MULTISPECIES: SRPBCC family protein [unclassified Xanthobacter]|uniref:aromatic ring-hydroxylating oxygenase subunit alpha n=1 Tax=unclassified Xanthobacter TaxID=2623496 RepID=UPI001F1C671E|nr:MULTISPECIES: aromatic ring-hydroxylating dioxygenase subunit alpha [unclassified Xanthobacter]
MSDTQQKWASAFPELGTGPIPVEPCVSPAFFDAEMEKVFKKAWLKVARVEEMPKAGDFKVKKLAFAHTSIILIRGKDGTVRGFHNVCSHRGNKVVVETGDETFGSSKAAVVTCRFHGWVYDAKGELVSVPEEEKFHSCFHRGENGLTPVRTEVWAGFVFVNLDAEGKESLTDFLGGIGRHLGDFPYEKMGKCYAYNTVLNCNWKVAHDAFAEAYHVATIHAGSFPNVFSSGLQNVQLFGPHRTTAVCLSMDAEPKPVAKLANSITGASLVTNRGASMLPPSVNPDRRPDFSFELSVLFPNLLLHVSEGIWFTHQFWPLAHNKTRWEGKYYLPMPKTNSEVWAQEFSQVLQRNAWLEDTATMEDTQDALESGAKTVMHLQDDEVLIRHGYHALEHFMTAAE